MPNYEVDVPFTGKLLVTVSADNKDEAKRKALEAEYTINISLEGNDVYFSDYEWDVTPIIVEGNYFHGILNEIEINEE